MRITLLAAGFVIGKSCQLCPIPSGNAISSGSAMFSLSSAHLCWYNVLPETWILRIKLEWGMSFSMNDHERTSFVCRAIWCFCEGDQ